MANWLHKFKREIMLIGPFRRLIFYFAEKKLYRDIVEKKDPEWVSYDFPRRAREDNFYLIRALIQMVNRGLAKGLISKRIFRRTFDFAANHLPENPKEGRKFSFLKNYGVKPPSFLAFSPNNSCNLHCSGCYSDTARNSQQYLPFETISRAIREQKDFWGSYLTIITGGEPFLYHDNEKTLFDLAARHPDTLFLVYTNGTLITEKVAEQLANLGNITPAVSVEGFKKETDTRRGPKIHQRIIETFSYLKKAGVPFGISITATRKNAELIMSDEFFDYYLNKQGASYAWIFQYAPMGRNINFELMVTPEQRIMMFEKTWQLIKERQLPVIDLWNCGTVLDGCMAAGKAHGYIHIDWNGNVTPCIFNPFSSQNIIEIYKNGGDLNSVLFSDFFKKIRQWQNGYTVKRPAEKKGDMIACCPMRDHHEVMQLLLRQNKVRPINDSAATVLNSKEYREKLIAYGKRFTTLSKEIWEKEYLAPEAKPGLNQNGSADD